MEFQSKNNQYVVDSVPSIIYKYREWKNPFHKRLLTHNEIYFSLIKNLNDPTDCSRVLNFDNRQIDKDTLLNFIKNECHYIKNPEVVKSIEKIQEASIEMIFNIYKRIRLRKLDFFYENDIKKELKISCFSGLNNIEEAWCKYGDSHYGFCVGYDTLKLVPFLVKQKINFHKVAYMDEPIFIDIADTDMQVYHKKITTKTTKWSYEDEFRFVKPKGAEASLTLDQNCIKSVIFGSKMANESKDEIMQVCSNNLQRIEYYQCERDNMDSAITVNAFNRLK